MINVLKNLDWSVLTDMFLSIIPVLITITVHEYCHGLTALALGDTTASREGRLSLNPLKHIDIIGFIMLIVVGFGWAKPVPVDMRKFRNPKRDMALTALAGPASNIVLSALLLFFYGLFYKKLGGSGIGNYVLYLLYYTAVLSAALAVFNIIPIPPLDGSKVLFSFLPNKWYMTLMRFEKYGMILMVIVLFTGILDAPLQACREALMNFLFVFADLGIKLTG